MFEVFDVIINFKYTKSLFLINTLRCNNHLPKKKKKKKKQQTNVFFFLNTRLARVFFFFFSYSIHSSGPKKIIF